MEHLVFPALTVKNLMFWKFPPHFPPGMKCSVNQGSQTRMISSLTIVELYAAQKSIHFTPEVEATAKLALFRKQLIAWKTDGISFVTLETIAREQLANKELIP
ncbi:MAG: hypothetical protein QM760_21935 [Nibricoccus sp.]